MSFPLKLGGGRLWRAAKLELLLAEAIVLQAAKFAAWIRQEMSQVSHTDYCTKHGKSLRSSIYKGKGTGWVRYRLRVCVFSAFVVRS